MEVDATAQIACVVGILQLVANNIAEAGACQVLHLVTERHIFINLVPEGHVHHEVCVRL